MNVGLVDYESGNLLSVSKALEHCGARVTPVGGPEAMGDCEAVVLPGVGAFGDAVASLRRRRLWDPVRDWILADRPFLGICLGYQMLFEASEESPGIAGMGVLGGQVVRFANTPERKIPHMGWNTVRPVPGRFPATPGSPSFYFVHSFHPVPQDDSVVSSWCDYGGEFAASVRFRRAVASQFHPEKSQGNGLALLESFLREATQ